MVKSISLAVLATLLASCGAMKSAGGVADHFVDKYYVESDQQGAMPYADGVAKLRLSAELSLVGDSRRGIAPGSHAAKVFYERKSLAAEAQTARADYALTIKPQGGTDILRTVQLELARQPDDTWRVTRFTETTPR